MLSMFMITGGLMMVSMVVVTAAAATMCTASMMGAARAARAAASAVSLVLGAQQVIQDVNNGGNVTLRLTVGVLKCWVQGAGEGARVDTLAMMVH